MKPTRFSTAEVARMCKVSQSKLTYRVQTGDIPEPKEWYFRGKCWTNAEAEKARRYFGRKA